MEHTNGNPRLFTLVALISTGLSEVSAACRKAALRGTELLPVVISTVLSALTLCLFPVSLFPPPLASARTSTLSLPSPGIPEVERSQGPQKPSLKPDLEDRDPDRSQPSPPQ